MTDKETLILAAISTGWIVSSGAHYETIGQLVVYKNGEPPRPWNSLTSNDDCFRLETERRLSVLWGEDYVLSGNPEYGSALQEFFKDHNGDKDKARRYASTRAAALIGGE